MTTNAQTHAYSLRVETVYCTMQMMPSSVMTVIQIIMMAVQVNVSAKCAVTEFSKQVSSVMMEITTTVTDVPRLVLQKSVETV